jgi:GT2 family glycosyltransferase
MPQLPELSICIANYNGAEILERCIQSALSQVTDFEFEVLIFDDASQDESAALIGAKFPELRAILSDKNVGFSRASNSLAKIAEGEFLLFLNNDAFLEPDALQQLWMESRHTQGILSLRQIDDQTGEEIDLGMGLDVFTVPYPLHEADSPRLATVIGACLWIPRELFFRAKGFPEWFESIAEDLYLCLFARITGAQIKVLSGSAYRHISGYSFGGGKADQPGETTSYRRRFLSERNRFFVTVLFFPTPLLLCLLPIWISLWALESIILVVTTRSLKPIRYIYGKALVDSIRHMGQLRRERAWVRSQRTIRDRDFLRPLDWVPHKLRFFLKHGVPRFGD